MPRPVAELTLPVWPPQVNRPSLEKLAELGQTDGVFSTAPDLDRLLP